MKQILYLIINYIMTSSKSIFLISLVLHLSLISCGDRKHKTENICRDISIEAITLDINPTKHAEIPFHKYFSDIELIPLETSEKAIIKNVGKIICYNENYYVLDDAQNSLLIFNKDGTLNGTLTKKGRGPGEYMELYDFNINHFTGNIEILDPRGKIFVYSQEYDFIETISIGIRATHRFHNINRDTIVFYTSSEFQKLTFYSRNRDSVIKRDYSYDKIPNTNVFPKYGNISPFSHFDGKTLFQVPYDNNIYDITDCNLKIHHIINFGKYGIEPEEIPKGRDDYFYIRYYNELKNKAFSILCYYEFSEIVLSAYLFNGLGYGLIFNKTNHLVDIVHKYSDGPFYRIFNNIDGNDGLRISSMDSTHLELYSNLLSEKQIEILKDVKPGDNMVISRYKLADRLNEKVKN